MRSSRSRLTDSPTPPGTEGPLGCRTPSPKTMRVLGNWNELVPYPGCKTNM